MRSNLGNGRWAGYWSKEFLPPRSIGSTLPEPLKDPITSDRKHRPIKVILRGRERRFGSIREIFPDCEVGQQVSKPVLVFRGPCPPDCGAGSHSLRSKLRTRPLGRESHHGIVLDPAQRELGDA